MHIQLYGLGAVKQSVFAGCEASHTFYKQVSLQTSIKITFNPSDSESMYV